MEGEYNNEMWDGLTMWRTLLKRSALQAVPFPGTFNETRGCVRTNKLRFPFHHLSVVCMNVWGNKTLTQHILH